MPHVAVRPARERDLSALAAIEDAGLAMFEGLWGDLTGTALAVPAPSGVERAADGFVLVAGDPPVGFVHVVLREGHAHLEQLSVLPASERRGVGRALVEAACERLAVQGHGQLTLMTYADVPWNAPFYARLGFEEVPADDPRTPHQAGLVEHEEALGLHDLGRRILMRRALRRHRTREELLAHLPVLDASPRDEGTLRLLVRRPGLGEREVLAEGELDLTLGLVGDSWHQRPSRRTPDGSPHPDMMLNVMNHPLIEFLAQDPEREALAGDQLFLDLDLSEDNLPEGTRLHFGDEGAVIMVTDQPHTGCARFISRFGRDALAFVNGREGKPRRLRGLCARVVVGGVVRTGDRVRVERPGDPVTDVSVQQVELATQQ